MVGKTQIITGSITDIIIRGGVAVGNLMIIFGGECEFTVTDTSIFQGDENGSSNQKV